MAKKIYTVLKLKDEFTKPLNKCTAQEKKLTKEAKLATAQINRMATSGINGFKKMGNSAKRAVQAMTGLGLAFSAVGAVNFGKESIEAYRAQLEAETKLEAVLGNVKSIAQGGASAIAEAKNQLTATASELQKVGVIGDEVTIAGMQQLATFQLQTDTIANLSEGMADLLAQQKGLNATQEDAVSVANLIGKAMSGQASALTRVGIIMNDAQKEIIKTGTEEEKAAALAEVLKENVGGVNKALAETDIGKIQQAKNNIGDMKEEIGKQLLPLVAQTMSYVNDNLPKIITGVKTAGKVGKTAFEKIGGAIAFCKKHSDVLLPVITGLVSGILAFKAANKTIATVRTLATTFKALKTASAVATLALNPMTIVPVAIATAIAGIVTAGVLLYKHWDQIKPKVQPVIDAFNNVRSAISNVIDKIQGAISKFKEFMGLQGGSTVHISTSGASYGGSNGHFATGTHYFSGGAAEVGEHGGEIINLPNGTQIIPHDISSKMATSGPNINVNVNIAGNVLGNSEYADYIGSIIARKVTAACANS